jgi:hypothetical protein
MTSILKLGDLLQRIDGYVSRRTNGLIIDEKGQKAQPLHPRAGAVLKEAAILGELPRSRDSGNS